MFVLVKMSRSLGRKGRGKMGVLPSSNLNVVLRRERMYTVESDGHTL